MLSCDIGANLSTALNFCITATVQPPQVSLLGQDTNTSSQRSGACRLGLTSERGYGQWKSNETKNARLVCCWDFVQDDKMLFIHCCHSVAIGFKVVQYSHPAAACKGVCAIAWSASKTGHAWELEHETRRSLMAKYQNGSRQGFIHHTISCRLICISYCRMSVYCNQEVLET